MDTGRIMNSPCRTVIQSGGALWTRRCQVRTTLLNQERNPNSRTRSIKSARAPSWFCKKARLRQTRPNPERVAKPSEESSRDRYRRNQRKVRGDRPQHGPAVSFGTEADSARVRERNQAVHGGLGLRLRIDWLSRRGSE